MKIKSLQNITSYEKVILEWREPLMQYNWCSHKKSKLDTDMDTGKASCKNWRYAAQARKYQKLGKGLETDLS